MSFAAPCMSVHKEIGAPRPSLSDWFRIFSQRPMASLYAFSLAGGLIFKFFGITLPAFEIAGGVILLLIGIEMIQAKRSTTQEQPGEAEEGAEKEDAGIVPLGIPMLAGPGAISTVMVLMGPTPTVEHTIPVFIAITLTSFLSFVILAGGLTILVKSLLAADQAILLL